jgi:hypothetical protein
MKNVRTFYFRGSDQSEFAIVAELWREYIGQRNPSAPYTQELVTLQESIRRCMRQEQDSYSRGTCSAARIATTKGHAVLIGKIRAEQRLKRGNND